MPKKFLLFMVLFLAASGVAAAERSTIFDERLLSWMRLSTSPDTGMPFSFSVPGSRRAIYGRMGRSLSTTGIIERVLVETGISVYDAAVWQIVLAHTGRADDLAMAGKPIEYYWNGALNSTEIRTGSGRQIFVYDHQRPEAVSSQQDRMGERGFVYRILNANGSYLSSDPLDGKSSFEGFPNGAAIHWEDWKPIAGENAWVVMAAMHVLSSRSPEERADPAATELRLAEELARAALFLQADNGGIRMAPLGTYYHLIGIDPSMTDDGIARALDQRARDIQQGTNSMSPERFFGEVAYPEYHIWYYEEISTENNLSWYAAFRMLWEFTGDDKYRVAMERIEEYLRSVWDANEGVFYQGAHFVQGAWVPNRDIFATDVQNWSIVVLGPQKIDAWFGAGTAMNIWRQTKKASGVYALYNGRLEGVGFTREHDRLSVEWTAGAILAVRKLKAYYGSKDGDAAGELDQDALNMREGVDRYRFRLSEGREAYAYSSRRGWIPFGWFSHEKSVLSLVSTGWVALIDAGMDPFVLPRD